MSLRFLSHLLLASVGVLLTSCSGGSDTRLSVPQCADPSLKFCMISCNLGCSVAGTCLVTEIAQNQPIVLNFSLPIDPASVTATALSLKTASGESPTGRFIVDGSSLVFQPEARLVGGSTVFGFKAQENYVLSMLAGSSVSLRSTSGDQLATPVVCSLSVTRGLIDLDGQPPRAELLVPTAESGVDPRTSIVVRFSELINSSNFGINTEVSPIRYLLVSTSNPNDPICPVDDPADLEDDDYFLIPGVPVATVEINDGIPQTVVTLQPAIALSSGSCVFVWIPDGAVQDLAGTPSENQYFHFTTQAGTSDPQTLTETFATDQRLDRPVSGGSWSLGTATPASLGGRGVHGSFNPTDGLLDGSGAYVWSTDTQTIPAERALFGDDRPEFLTVVDGQYEFTDFIVPSGVTVRFRGSKPAVIRVRGEVRIEGEVLLDGQVPSSTFDPSAVLGPGFPPTYLPKDGQDPALGGAGGGDGGRGADGCDGTQALPVNSGQPGGGVSIPMGSGYVGQGAASGGRGGPLFPADGLQASVTLNLFSSVCGQLAGGGGGGAFLGTAAVGRAIATYSPPPADVTDRGPDSVAGVALTFVPRPSGVSSLEHFLIGGSGGGGGGSQPLNMVQQQVQVEMRPWHAGAAGCGGGGAIALRAGHTLTLSGAGTVAARGGGGVSFDGINPSNPPSPGGAGSGGSILLQVQDVSLLSQGGVLDVSGGAANRLRKAQFVPPPAESTGGAGGRGYVRVEADNISAAQVGTIEPSAAAQGDYFGALEDTDDYSGFTALWRSTRQLFEPAYSHYRLEARIAGQTVVFSDSTEPGEFNPANSDTLALRVYVQGGEVNAGNDQLIGEPGPWRDFVNPDAGPSIADGVDATGYRFMIFFNRAVETDVTVQEFSVTYQPR